MFVCVCVCVFVYDCVCEIFDMSDARGFRVTNVCVFVCILYRYVCVCVCVSMWDSELRFCLCVSVFVCCCVSVHLCICVFEFICRVHLECSLGIFKYTCLCFCVCISCIEWIAFVGVYFCERSCVSSHVYISLQSK